MGGEGQFMSLLLQIIMLLSLVLSIYIKCCKLLAEVFLSFDNKTSTLDQKTLMLFRFVQCSKKFWLFIGFTTTGENCDFLKMISHAEVDVLYLANKLILSLICPDPVFAPYVALWTRPS